MDSSLFYRFTHNPTARRKLPSRIFVLSKDFAFVSKYKDEDGIDCKMEKASSHS